MAELVEFTLNDGGSVLVEVDESRAGIGTVSRRDGTIVRDLQEAFERRLNDVRKAAGIALDALREDLSPDEFKLTFGVKLTAEAGAVIARTSAEAHLVIEMQWNQKKGSPAIAGSEDT